MKILYISSNKRSQQFPWLVDYQNDSLLYGLKELFGDDDIEEMKKQVEAENAAGGDSNEEDDI